MVDPLVRGKQMAAHHVIREELDGGWSFLATDRHGCRTSRVESTSLGWIDEIWDHPRNPLNLSLLSVGQAIEQFLGVGMRGMAEERCRRRHLRFLASIHHGHPVAELSHDPKVMRDEEDRPLVGFEIDHQVAYHQASGR